MLLLFVSTVFAVFAGSYAATMHQSPQPKKPRVLILGGGVAGITAARALYNQSVNFVLIEAGDELGGRLKSCQFGNMTVEAGGDSIEGTQTGSGPSNPIFELTKKQSIETQFTDFVHSITTFNSSGQLNFIDIVNSAAGYYTNLTVAADTRVQKNQTDLSARAGYALSGAKRAGNSREKTAEYYQFDGGYGQRPEETSRVTASWVGFQSLGSF